MHTWFIKKKSQREREREKERKRVCFNERNENEEKMF